MHPERMIFNDAPALIPVPEAFQHRKIEVILWPLDDEPVSSTRDTSIWNDFFAQFSRQVEDASPCSRDDCYADRLR